MLKADGVVVGYRGQNVLNGVSLEISQGEFLGILGPNGAGKSTLLKTMTRVLSPREGRISFMGRPLESVPLKELAREMAVLPAETYIAYDFTVLEIVKMGRAPYLNFWSEGGARDLDIVRSALFAAGIEHLAQRGIRTLSSGEKQMVFLAQAMAQQPKILLLDEPTVHLDIGHQIQIFKILKEWNEGGLTIAVISHDINIAARFCKRLALMREGRLVKDGTPREVVTEENLKNTYGIDTRVIVGPQTGTPAVLFD